MYDKERKLFLASKNYESNNSKPDSSEISECEMNNNLKVEYRKSERSKCPNPPSTLHISNSLD